MRMKTLLVVDDEPSLVYVTALLLRAQYHVLTAGDGFQALEVLANQKVDAIVTDFRMPGMNGLELLAKVPKIPGLLATAVGDDAIWAAADTAGVKHRIEKPWEIDDMLQAVEALLAQPASKLTDL
jgi:two-component system response regulator AtoC